MGFNLPGEGIENGRQVHLPFSVFPSEGNENILVPFARGEKDGSGGFFTRGGDPDCPYIQEMGSTCRENHPVKGVEDKFETVELPELLRRIAVPEGEAGEELERREGAEAGVVLIAG